MSGDNIQPVMSIVFCVIGVMVVIAIVFMSSSRGMSQMMKRTIKMQKDILDENEEDLKEISAKSANIEKEAIEIKARAVRDGFINNEEKEDNKYCKYCDALIDDDSLFCKKCGKKQ